MPTCGCVFSTTCPRFSCSKAAVCSLIPITRTVGTGTMWPSSQHVQPISPIYSAVKLQIHTLIHSESRRLKRRKAFCIPFTLLVFKPQSLHRNLLNKPSSLSRSEKPNPPLSPVGGRMTVDELAKHFLASRHAAGCTHYACSRGKDLTPIISSIWPF